MRKITLVSILVACGAARASAACANRNVSLVKFFSEGREVHSQLLQNDPSKLRELPPDSPGCFFGGNNTFTPKHHIRVFVNFNIPGAVNLDEIDEAYDRHAAGTPQGEIIRGAESDFALVFVDQAWLNGRYSDSWHGAGLNNAKKGLYISEYNLQDGSLPDIYAYFFGNQDLWFNPNSAPQKQEPVSPRFEL
ncbi:MAG: hypothetical protein AAB036_02320 [Elusimicrobiota bacterium]